ncbi:hypothetical protein C8P68_104322 [Mucilaginibacter yixingensis]|uniref:Uncharacterized protein n=1 Tax=Mucilaginibacter yixingensis TaxID=1295612 RepID=A0A2T5J9T1_9SPHI|nr:hypothetical protein C8P68_104322 [Mucilaginibacter yixingensis]
MGLISILYSWNCTATLSFKSYHLNMKTTRLNHRKSWLYKLMVMLTIPFLFIYYNILKPPVIFIKELIAEQDGSLHSKTPEPRAPDVKRLFLSYAVKKQLVMTVHYLSYLKRYKWPIALLFVAWLIYSIGLWPAVASIVIWFTMWLLNSSYKDFSKNT